MIRIHTDDYVPKYNTGVWFWNDMVEEIKFDSHYDRIMAQEIYRETNGFKFLTLLNQVEEMIYRQEFQRADTTFDNDVILVRDIMNLVLFLAPSEIVTKEFIEFLNKQTITMFFKALIIYFEYFLKVVEFALIRRDDISGDQPQIQSTESIEIKRIYSSYLSQYRIMVAREYSKIILGEGEMQAFHHLVPIVNISKSIHDKGFHEGFLAFSTQLIWIAMHRRAYDVIDMEMNRLFRSEHFKLRSSDPIQLNDNERSMLYGKNYKRVNYRAQNSPLIQELMNISDQDRPILWIGEHKYRGMDLRLHQIEMEFIVPSSQLVLIDVTHGILGHPKKLYNTLLQLEWSAVRERNYNETYDPYHLVNQPCLKIPDLNEENMRKNAEHFEPHYTLEHIYESWDKITLQKWLDRDRLINHFRTTGVLTNIWVKCDDELSRREYGPSVTHITKKFINRIEKMRKKA